MPNILEIVLEKGLGFEFFKRSDNYKKYKTVETEEEPSLTRKDSKEILIDCYLYAFKLNDNGANKISCALEFWGQDEHNCKKMQKRILVFLIFGMC